MRSAWRSEKVRTRSGPQRKDLVDVRRGEGTHPWFLAASLRRAHDIAGNADDAFLLAGQIQCLEITCPAATEKKPTPFAGCRPHSSAGCSGLVVVHVAAMWRSGRGLLLGLFGHH